MISKPLFRTGDYVTLRNDINGHDNYSMLHDPVMHNCYIDDEYIQTNGRLQIEDANYWQYQCCGAEWYLTDGMFAEGARVMQYLDARSSVPANTMTSDWSGNELRSGWVRLADALRDDARWYTTYGGASYLDIASWCAGT